MFEKKHFFDQNCFFDKKKIREKMPFFEEIFFRFNALRPNFVQFNSYAYQNIRYILFFKVPKQKLKKNQK
jgi:hypothetical protein